jgi:ArsR family transcriptional regulator
MSQRRRPPDCCTESVPVRALRAAERTRQVAVFRALGDPTRLEIFRFIAAQPEPACVCDIVDQFVVSQPTISHHLKTLREAGLVTVSRRGVWAHYTADPAGLTRLEHWLAQFTTAGAPTLRLAAAS